MASLTRWTWVWVNSRSWWWTGSPGVLQFMGSKRVEHDWATDLIWSDLFFNWRIIALQNFVVFCQTSTWIRHRCTVCPLPLEPTSHLSPHPTPLGWYRAPVWVPWDIQQIPIGYLFYKSHLKKYMKTIYSTPFPVLKATSLLALYISKNSLLN